MAIIFKPPKRKKRVLFWSISFFIILVLTIIFLAAFPPILKDQLTTVLEDVVVSHIEVNFDILNSRQVKDLDPFEGMAPNTDSIGRSEPFLPY